MMCIDSNTIHLRRLLYSNSGDIRFFLRSIPHNADILMIFTQSLPFTPELEFQVRRPQNHLEIEVCTIVARFKIVPGFESVITS
jgi:hypothetical protein